MLKIDKKMDGATLVWTLKGVIDEHAGFEEQFESGPTQMTVICRDVERINSVGVLLWRRFFSKMRRLGVKVSFREVAPSILIQTGFIVDLVLKDEVESGQLPFSCSSCGKSFGVTFGVAELRAFAASPKPSRCPNCGADAVFDEIIEEYVGFLG